MFTGLPESPNRRHHLSIADTDRIAVDACPNALAGDFFYLLNATIILFLRIGTAQRLGNRVSRKSLDMSSQMKQLFLLNDFRMNVGNVKRSFGQSTGFIKDNSSDFRQCFQIVRAFNQDALPAGTAQSGKKR